VGKQKVSVETREQGRGKKKRDQQKEGRRRGEKENILKEKKGGRRHRVNKKYKKSATRNLIHRGRSQSREERREKEILP